MKAFGNVEVDSRKVYVRFGFGFNHNVEDVIALITTCERVKQIRGVTYLRKDRKEGDETRKAGVIAQEVEKVLPEVVIEQENGKSVDYGNMVSLLIEAIKEQQVQIEELKSKINN